MTRAPRSVLTEPLAPFEWLGGQLDGDLSAAPVSARTLRLIDRGAPPLLVPIRVRDDGHRHADYYAAVPR